MSDFMYHHYRSLIRQVYDNEVEMAVEELEEKIYRAYQDDLLDAREYDSLCVFLTEL